MVSFNLAKDFQWSFLCEWLSINSFNFSKKYPMIISVYGGPESQEVDQRWSVDWKGELIRTSNLDLN